MKPRIGITVNAREEPEDKTGGRLWLNWNYAQVVADAGGVPILIPPQADPSEVSSILHGWLIPGGQDIPARHFGETDHPEVVPVEEERFQMEAAIYRAVPHDLPILGICYGCQFINVMRGGKLIQHMPDVLGHNTHAEGEGQTYRIAPDSKLGAILGNASAQGKSYHHQAVGQLGSNLQTVATHEDGTVEAVEATDRPWVIGVQWHPERTFQTPESKRLFEDFVRAATTYARDRQRAAMV